MKKSTIYFIILIVAIIAAIIIFKSSKSSAGEEYTEFAQCLTDSGVKMFGAFWCPHCQNQKKLFGVSWNRINYVECSTPDGNSQTQICIDEKIQSYPTWEFADKSRVNGELTLQELSARSGCELTVQ